MKTAKDKLIVALDFDSADRALDLFDALRDVAGMFKIGSQLFTAAGPDVVRQIVADVNTARAPCLWRIAGNFQDQIPFSLGERLKLLPIGQIQFGDRSVRRQRRRINDPRVGNHLEHPLEK